LLVAVIIVLVVHGHTDVKYMYLWLEFCLLIRVFLSEIFLFLPVDQFHTDQAVNLRLGYLRS